MRAAVWAGEAGGTKEPLLANIASGVSIHPSLLAETRSRGAQALIAEAVRAAVSAGGAV